MEPFQFKLLGPMQGWIDTGIYVPAGTTLRISATGTIDFATGNWRRNADGADDKGHIEKADGFGLTFPAHNFHRNSLVLKVGDIIYQGGTQCVLKIQSQGTLYVSNNDNYSMDNVDWNHPDYWLVNMTADNPQCRYAGDTMAFVNRTETLGQNWIGHIGWGFKLDDMRFCYGSTEHTAPPIDLNNLTLKQIADALYVPPGKPNGTFIARGTIEQVKDSLAEPQKQDSAYPNDPLVAPGPAWPYHEFKLFSTRPNDQSAAIAAAIQTAHTGYNFISSEKRPEGNCLDYTYKVLAAFCHGHIPMQKMWSLKVLPNAWFDALSSVNHVLKLIP